MTKKEIRKLVDYWVPILGLELWRIKVNFEEFDRISSPMQVNMSATYDRATIKVQDWVVKQKPPPDTLFEDGFSDEDTEQSMVHELLHLSIARLSDWTGLVDGMLPKKAYRVAFRSYDNAEERFVDQTAAALVAAFGTTKGS